MSELNHEPRKNQMNSLHQGKLGRSEFSSNQFDRQRGVTEKHRAGMQNSFSNYQQKIWSERAQQFRERIQNKREQLMFSKKLQLIKRHLNDHNHPLRLLRKQFSNELRTYYELFLEVNRGTTDTNNTDAKLDTEQNEQKSTVDRSLFIKKSFMHGTIIESTLYQSRRDKQ